MFITAYSYISDPLTCKLPVYECIESIYNEVDEIVVYDTSKYDAIDLRRYGKVRKHVHGLFNPMDNPIGSAFTSALKLVESDICFCLDCDEIYDFSKENLRDIVKKYPLETGAGISFGLINYFGDKHHIIDGCSTRGPVILKNREGLYHDVIRGFEKMHSNIRRTTIAPDSNDGCRLVDSEGRPVPHWQPIPLDLVPVHHTSHLDPVSKMIRSILQFNHTTTLDLPQFFPYDMRVSKAAIDKIYECAQQDIDAGEFELYGTPIPYDYQKNDLLEKFIARAGIKEFNPEEFKILENTFTGNVVIGQN